MEKYIKIYAGQEVDYLLRSDGITEARQPLEINVSSLLTFTINSKSPKVKNLYYPDLIAECGGRRYCISGDNGVNKSRAIDGVYLNVEMKELWYELSKTTVTAHNIDIATSTQFDHIDQHMVVLLGNSTYPVNINGNDIENPYEVGTAPYMFYSILYATEWNLDPRYSGYWPDGKFDLETDKKGVLENIQLLQSFYGGMLFWDSVNMLVALVDENKYQKFSGYEVRYGYNLIGIEKRENRNITTRLYVYGNENLNIAAVNDGLEYIDNFSYTSRILEDIITNNDIYDQSPLLQWGQRQSEILCRPRYEYNIEILKYAENGFAQRPQPILGELARVIDDEIVGEPVLRRILSIDQSVFDESDCNLKIGDVIETFEGKFKDVTNTTTTTQIVTTSFNQVTGTAISNAPLNTSNLVGTIDTSRLTGIVSAENVDWQGAQGETLNIDIVNARAAETETVNATQLYAGQLYAGQLSLVIGGIQKPVGVKAIEGQAGLFLYVEQ